MRLKMDSPQPEDINSNEENEGSMLEINPKKRKIIITYDGDSLPK